MKPVRYPTDRKRIVCADVVHPHSNMSRDPGDSIPAIKAVF